MAHELDTITGTDTAAFFGRKSAWHNLGNVLPDDFSGNVEDVMRLAGLDFDVVTEPFYVNAERTLASDTDEGDAGDVLSEFHEVDGFRVTRRTDRVGSDSVLGVVKGRYVPLQNRDAFRVLEPLLDAGLARVETAGALRGGRDVWALVRFNLTDERVVRAFASRVVNGKENGGTVPFGLIANNHAGQREVRMMETPVEVVCANTLGAAMRSFGDEKKRGRAFSVRHTLNVERKTTEAARELFADVTERYVEIAAQYEALRATFLDVETFRRLVLDVAAPVAKRLQAGNLTSRERTSRERVDAIRDLLTAGWQGKATGTTGDGSAWDAYMSVTESIDHDGETWRTRGGVEGRAASLFDGRLGDVKNEVADALVSYAFTPEPERDDFLASFTGASESDAIAFAG
jgi:phage/plasmid-like protein (TIGR03299 family)